MRAAINLEGVFAVLVLCGVAFGRGIASSRDETSRRWNWLLLLLIPVALLWTLSFPLVSDDFVHIRFALHFNPTKIVELFSVPGGDRFFRPLGYMSFALDALWAGRNPALWHLSALMIHFANCLLVAVIARRMGMTVFFAAAAAVIFGIHGSRPEAVTWIASRFDLIATFFVLATLCLAGFGNSSRVRYAAAIAIAFLAVISKESAYVLPVLLLLITPREQWRRVIPFAALTAAVFAYRWHLLSGIGGYLTAEHTPAIFNFHVLATANALFLRLWAVLFFPINWSEPAQWWLWIALVAGVLAYGAIALRATHLRRKFTLIAFVVIAALPVQQLLLIGPGLEKSRVLYLPSVGFALLVASASETLRHPSWRRPAAIALIVLQLACLEHNLIVWRGVAIIAQRTCDTVAQSLTGNQKTVALAHVPDVLRGVYFLHTGVPECLDIRHGIDAGRAHVDGTGDIRLNWDRDIEALR